MGLYLDGVLIGNVIRIGNGAATLAMSTRGTIKVEQQAGSKLAKITPDGMVYDSVSIQVEINGETYRYRYQQAAIWQAWRTQYTNEMVSVTLKQTVASVEQTVNVGYLGVASVTLDEMIDNGGGANVTFSFTGTGDAMKLNTNIVNGDFLMPQGASEELMLAPYGWTSNAFATSRSTLTDKVYRAAQTTDGPGLIASFDTASTGAYAQTELQATASADAAKDVLVVNSLVSAIDRNTPESTTARGDARYQFVAGLFNGTSWFSTIHEVDINTERGVLCSIACPLPVNALMLFKLSFDYVCNIKVSRVWAEVRTNRGV